MKNLSISLIIPVGIFVIFAILTEGRTATMAVFTATIRQSIIPILICWGLILNMSAGMINFSAGAIMVFASIVGGNLANTTGLGIFGLVLFCMLMAIIAGAITGMLYNRIRVPAMVLTIGMLLVWESVPRFFYPAGVTISPDMTLLARTPYIYFVFGIMLIGFHLLFNYTTFGHNLRAIGNSQAIASSAGLNIDKIKLMSFVFGAVFLGAAATLHISSSSDLRNVASMASMTLMMDAFMGMFMAMFLAKFCNMSIAVIIGTFSMRMLSNGFVAIGFSATARDIVQGLFLLVLLAISANAGLFEKRKADKEFADNANREYQT
ncbi:MAG: hypothetical protein FWF81_10020 [Defluviitaleaceae bacterium]|nr:hypothetical protein [Defluviitaleaceae bacterium]